MDEFKFDTTIDLADRISALEAAANVIVAAINSYATHFDALDGRLDSAEKTISAMGDALKTTSPETIASNADEIANIRARVNAFYGEVMGPSAPNTPFPVPPSDTPT